MRTNRHHRWGNAIRLWRFLQTFAYGPRAESANSFTNRPSNPQEGMRFSARQVRECFWTGGPLLAFGVSPPRDVQRPVRESHFYVSGNLPAREPCGHISFPYAVLGGPEENLSGVPDTLPARKLE